MLTPVYRLTFLLPAALGLIPNGRHHPSIHGCLLVIHGGLVTIEGPSRERVFQQVRRFMRIHAKGHGALAITAVLEAPPRPGCRGGKDSYQIIVNAETAIVATSIEPDLGVPELLERAAS